MNTIKFKDGVTMYGLQPEMVFALDCAAAVYGEKGYDCIMTSGRGDTHGAHSHHYKGLAVDLRRWHVENKTHLREIIQNIKARLGGDYQVILEATHIHIEFDPMHAPEYMTRGATVEPEETTE